MQKANFIKSDKQMQEHQAITFIWFKENDYFVSEVETDICPWHKKEVVPTMMGFFQCPDCAMKHLEIIKKQQQPLVNMAVADWERRAKLTDKEREEEDKRKHEEWLSNKRKQNFTYANQ